MGFIKFAEEKKWKAWKEQEEIILRNHGVKEAVIKELYEYDWHDFKRNRSFGEHQTVSDDLVHFLGCSLDTYEVTSMDALLDQLSDVKLYYLLKDLDNLTQMIIYMKFQGYSSMEISKKLHVTVRSIDCKLYRLRKKYKNQ